MLRDARARIAGRVPLGGSQPQQKGQVRAQLRTVVEEYLLSHDVAEVTRRVSEIALPTDLEHELVRAAIELGLERRDHDREMVSQLLSSSYAELVCAQELSRGFEQLLLRLDDLAVDNPSASAHLAAFLVRAVEDDILPPAFVTSFATSPPPAAYSTPMQLDCLTRANAQLKACHFGERRRHVWGAAADGDVETLKKEVATLCAEYLISGELDEAVRCVRELDAPLYHHEVVKRVAVIALDATGSRELERASDLVDKLCAEQLLTPEQLSQGCARLVDAVDDLRLDNPKAPELLSQFFVRACAKGHLRPEAEWRATAAKLSGGA